MSNLIISQWPFKLIDFLQKKFSYFGHSLDLQLLDDAFDVGARLGVAKALLIQEDNLVVKDVQLLKKAGLSNGTLNRY